MAAARRKGLMGMEPRRPGKKTTPATRGGSDVTFPSFGRRRNSLLRLDEFLNPTKNAAAESFDDGQPLAVFQSSVSAAYELTEVPLAAPLGTALDADAPFTVESFEDEANVFSLADRDPETTAGEPADEEPAVMAPSAIAASAVAAVPAAEEGPAANAATSLAALDAEAFESMPAAERAGDAEAFEQDLMAILGGRPVDTPVPEESVAAAAEDAASTEPPHAVFDRIGRNMAEATTFDLGEVEVRRTFDELDRALDAAEPRQAARIEPFVGPLALDDLDLAEDFDIMTSAAQTKPMQVPVAQEPAEPKPAALAQKPAAQQPAAPMSAEPAQEPTASKSGEPTQEPTASTQEPAAQQPAAQEPAPTVAANPTAAAAMPTAPVQTVPETQPASPPQGTEAAVGGTP